MDGWVLWGQPRRMRFLGRRARSHIPKRRAPARSDLAAHHRRTERRRWQRRKAERDNPTAGFARTIRVRVRAVGGCHPQRLRRRGSRSTRNGVGAKSRTWRSCRVHMHRRSEPALLLGPARQWTQRCPVPWTSDRRCPISKCRRSYGARRASRAGGSRCAFAPGWRVQGSRLVCGRRPESPPRAAASVTAYETAAWSASHHFGHAMARALCQAVDRGRS